jgi:hypothetical protein
MKSTAADFSLTRPATIAKEGRQAAQVKTNRNSREFGVRFETVSGGTQ